VRIFARKLSQMLVSVQSQHTVSVSFQLCCAPYILFFLFLVHSPIQLNYQPVLGAVEISNKGSDRVLAPELQAL